MFSGPPPVKGEREGVCSFFIVSFDFVQDFAIIFVQNISNSQKTMTTEIVSLSEYRKNISVFTKRANEQNICFIITSHGKPVWEYKPLSPKDIKITTKYSQDFIDELAEMERDYEAGNFVSFENSEDMRKYFDKFL